MKNKFIFLGIIALIAVIGFTMVACDNGTTKGSGSGSGINIPSELHGTWELELTEGSGTDTITFTKTSVTAKGMLAGFQTAFDAVKDIKGIKVTMTNGNAVLVANGQNTPWFDYEVSGTTLKIGLPGMLSSGFDLVKK